jgi:hypothetical protein
MSGPSAAEMYRRLENHQKVNNLPSTGEISRKDLLNKNIAYVRLWVPLFIAISLVMVLLVLLVLLCWFVNQRVGLFLLSLPLLTHPPPSPLLRCIQPAPPISTRGIQFHTSRLDYPGQFTPCWVRVRIKVLG